MFKRSLVTCFAIFSMLAILACGGGGEPAAGGGESGAAAGAGGEEAGGMIDPATITDGGNIAGTVDFTGEAPEAGTIQMSADPFCLNQHTEPVSDARVVVNDNDTLRHVFVYVKEGFGDAQFPTSSEPVTLDQNGCLYEPHVVGVQTGQTVSVVNSDDTLHNVNAQPQNNDPFNFAQPVMGMTNEVTFENSEVMIPVKCDVQPWMSSYIGVLDNPYFATSGTDGNFSLDNLPPGDYVIAAWHETLGEMTQNVTVATGETAEISFSFGSS